MKNISLLLLVLSIALPNSIHAQETNPKEKISNVISTYFELDRETIHVHLNKNIYFSNEQIWFKGYVFNKKNGAPFFETTNVFAVVFDDSGKQLMEKLVFSNNGTFAGSIKLGSAFKSGRYHIHFYTNWMNNFSEDESSAYSVNIINVEEGALVNLEKPNLSQIQIEFHPEGGSFIEGVTNNLGIKITDCNGNPTPVQEGQIQNSKGEILKNFIVSKLGFAKVYFEPANETYKAVFKIDDRTIEANLPTAVLTGIALEVNNYAVPGKTILKIRTNQRTLSSIPGKSLFAVVHQNEKSNIFDINFNNSLEQEIAFTNTNLFAGSNVVRIIDANMKQWAERVIFEFPESKSSLTSNLVSKRNDSLHLSGKIAYPNANISISILPGNTIAEKSDSDIFASFYIDPYLTAPVGGASHYLNDPSRARRYEMDLMLLNQNGGKYEWNNILSAPPKMTFDFDIGIAVKGTLNQTISDKKNYRIQLLSPAMLINDYSVIDDNNNFSFKNLIIADSTMVKYTLMKLPSVPVDIKLYQQVLNRKRIFNKPFAVKKLNCEAIAEKLALNDMPQFGRDVIVLDAIKITGKSKKAELKYQRSFGNASLRGIKIGPENGMRNLVTFLQTTGFDAGYNRGQVYIYSRHLSGLNSLRMSPEVYMNGRMLLSFDELAEITIDQVDEIYVDPNAIVASMRGNIGIIKIYMKKLGYDDQKSQSKQVIIAEGFAVTPDFVNPIFVSTSGTGFQNYGAVYWIPSIVTDLQGGFKFDVPDLKVPSIKILIEGMTPDGKLISEIQTLKL